VSDIRWDDSFCVHHPEIDDQHKKWFSIYFDLDEFLLKGNFKESNKVAIEILEKILHYADDHFKFEEDYMRRTHYPDIIKHTREHKDLKSKAYAYKRDLGEGRMVLNTEILGLIKNWILDHILVEDRKIV